MPAKDLRVVDRGSFFDDSFFQDSWEDFDKAMKNVLQGHGAKTENQSRTQRQDMYRQLRSNRIDEDMYASQAVQLTEKDGKFLVVLDVKDFNPRDLQVKVVEERIILEGRYDKVSDDGKSSTSKAFYREFTLPAEANIDQVSTALSKDGILTIKAPRKEGLPIRHEPEMNTTQASNLIQNALNANRMGSGSTFKNSKKFAQPPPSYDTTDGYDTLSKDLRERLMCSDRDSGRSSASGSPIPSGYSSTPSCASPSPSDQGLGRMQSPYQKSDNYPTDPFSRPAGAHQSSFDNRHQTFSPPPPPPPPQTNVSRMQHPTRPMAATGSGGTATISVKEEDGKRTMTSEKTSLVQENDGFLESKEVSAEVTEKDSQAVRREATTRMVKHDEDPEGKFKKKESADASDVSETCVKQMPDGSTMTVKKSSTSTSNFKQSFSSGNTMPPSLFGQNFPAGMDDFDGFMGRGTGPSLMSQMSSDSIGSNRSAFSDMSSFSRMSDMSNFSNMSNRPFSNNQGSDMSNMSNRPFSNNQGFSNNFPDLSSRSGFPNFPNTNQVNQSSTNPNGFTNSTNYSTSSSQSSFSSSNFDNKKF